MSIILSRLAATARSSRPLKSRVNPQLPEESVYREANDNISEEAAKHLTELESKIVAMQKRLEQQKVKNEELDAEHRERSAELTKRREEIDAMIAEEERRIKRATDIANHRKFSKSIKTHGGRRGRGNNLRKSRRRRTTRKR